MFEDVTDHPTILGVAIIVFILTFAVNGGGGKSRPFPVSDSFLPDHTWKTFSNKSLDLVGKPGRRKRRQVQIHEWRLNGGGQASPSSHRRLEVFANDYLSELVRRRHPLEFGATWYYRVAVQFYPNGALFFDEALWLHFLQLMGVVNGQRYDYMEKVTAVILILTRGSSGVGVIHEGPWHLGEQILQVILTHQWW